MELANYRICSASRVIVASSEMAFMIAMSQYGTEIYPHSFLKLFAYSAYLYEHAAVPFYPGLTSGLARSALHFIGTGIEDHRTSKEFCRWTGLLDRFGSNWPAGLMTCPTKGIFGGYKDGDRSAYMETLLQSFDDEAMGEIKLIANGAYGKSIPSLIDCAAKAGAKILSKELYHAEVITTDFVKDNYAFIQTSVEQYYAKEKERFK